MFRGMNPIGWKFHCFLACPGQFVQSPSALSDNAHQRPYGPYVPARDKLSPHIPTEIESSSCSCFMFWPSSFTCQGLIRSVRVSLMLLGTLVCNSVVVNRFLFPYSFSSCFAFTAPFVPQSSSSVLYRNTSFAIGWTRRLTVPVHRVSNSLSPLFTLHSDTNTGIFVMMRLIIIGVISIPHYVRLLPVQINLVYIQLSSRYLYFRPLIVTTFKSI